MESRSKSLVLHALAGLGVNALLRLVSAGSARVVTYHGVEESADPVVNYDGLQIAPLNFSRHVDWLARTFRVMPLRDLVAGLRGDAELPRRALAITFDDGYRNNLTDAARILRAKGVPATFFITTGFVERTVRPWWYAMRALLARAAVSEVCVEGRVFDVSTPAARRVAAIAIESAWRFRTAPEQQERLAALAGACGVPTPAEPYPFLSVEEVGRLAQLGFDVQAHGERHLSLRAEPGLADDEIAVSARKIAAWTGLPQHAYALPYGHVPDDADLLPSALRRAGLHVAATTRAGRNKPGSHAHLLARYDVHGGRTVENLNAWVSGTLGRRGA